MKNQFEFYEVVAVLNEVGGEAAEVAGQRGSVLGMGQDEDTKQWSYSVSMDSTGEVWTFNESDLQKTGDSRKRSDYYSGETARVQIDPSTGDGSLSQKSDRR